MAEKLLRRLTLRQLMASSEKASRDLAELVQTHLLPRVVDFRGLTRPVRRKSQYPKVLAFQNGLRRMMEANEQVKILLMNLQEHLEAIRDYAQRERLSRKP